jgi:hypothetical protein
MPPATRTASTSACFRQRDFLGFRLLASAAALARHVPALIRGCRYLNSCKKSDDAVRSTFVPPAWVLGIYGRNPRCISIGFLTLRQLPGWLPVNYLGDLVKGSRCSRINKQCKKAGWYSIMNARHIIGNIADCSTTRNEILRVATSMNEIALRYR